MRILFLVYHGFSDSSGITKKIHYQVKGLRENGHEVHLCYYGFSKDGHRCRFVDDEVIKDYGTGKLAALRQRLGYGCIADYCISHHIEFVYARCFQNASPFLISLFRRLKNAGIKSVTEIPTYPYDDEFRTFQWKMRMELKVDQLFRNQLYKYMEAMVTFSDAKEIFGQRTIQISNGVDFDSIPLYQPVPPVSSEGAGNDTPLHLIGVAEVHPWHAFDRVITGMGEYYKKGGKKEVFFHIVGGVHPNQMTNVFRPVIEQYGLQERVVFHGQLFGDELTRVFNQCQFAIGSLGRHRSGITVIKTLKNREYATRGIPFIYSEQDSDFDHQPYVLKALPDESPVDIQQIIDFVEHFDMAPQDIRSTVNDLRWSIQMQKVIESL